MTSEADISVHSDRRAWRGPRRAVWIGAVMALLLGYLVYLFVNFSVFHDRDIYYPQKVLSQFDAPLVHSPAANALAADTEVSSGTGGGGSNPSGSATSGALPDADGANCAPSRTVAMQIRLIELMVRDNAWVPARPLYKAGFFGLVDFADTPWFDNKAAEQIGILDITRRLAIEMTDSLGRVRGTSAENETLNQAQASLRIDENAWYLNNPFSDTNTISPSAAASYEKAIRLYSEYNMQLESCEAVFDARTDNLRETLSRFTATLGSTIVELGSRSQAVGYDVETHRFVDMGGVDAGWFDFQADNHFHRARGKMYALHGILQGMRLDFGDVLAERNLDAVWDKMEASVAEAALLDPWLISNGARDGALFPDHLGVMAEMILRARTSMVELRDILAD